MALLDNTACHVTNVLSGSVQANRTAWWVDIASYRAFIFVTP